MSMRGSTKRIMLVVIAGSVLGLSTSADAQHARRDDGALRGPRVRETRVPGQESRLTDSQMRGRPVADGMKRHATFIQGLRMLGSGRIGEDLRLTEDQIIKLRKMEQNFRSSVKQFGQQRGKDSQRKVDRTRDRTSADGKRGPRRQDRSQTDKRPDRQRNFQRPERDDEMRRDVNRRPRDAKPTDMRDMRPRANGPERGDRGRNLTQDRSKIASRITDHEKRLFMVLTEAQRQALRQHMERVHKKDVQQRKDKVAHQRDTKGRGFGQQRGGKERLTDRIPTQLRQRLENLSPEERQRVIKRLRNRIKAGEFDQRLERKPRPQMDEVDIFPPDDGDN